MASAVGMTIRTSKANERIDAALAVLAAGSNAPAKPEKVRDALYNDVLRVEWIADTLESLSGTGEQVVDATAEPADEPEPKPVARKARKANG